MMDLSEIWKAVRLHYASTHQYYAWRFKRRTRQTIEDADSYALMVMALEDSSSSATSIVSMGVKGHVAWGVEVKGYTTWNYMSGFRLTRYAYLVRWYLDHPKFRTRAYADAVAQTLGLEEDTDV